MATRLDQATQDIHTLRHEVGAREEQLRTLHRHLQSSEENCATLQQAIQQRDREVSELRQATASDYEQVLTTQMHQVTLLEDKRQLPSMRPVTIERWQSIPDVYEDMMHGSSTVIRGKMYIMAYHSYYRVYEFSDKHWKKLPYCPTSYCTIININDILTTVGGGGSLLFPSYALYSYIDSKWVENFPPMPTARWKPGAVYANKTLVVAGGKTISWYGVYNLLTTVEILNTVNRQWSSVSSLPVNMYYPSATICGDYVYIHPRTNDQEKNSVYKCSLEQLVQSQPSSATWENITSLPVSCSSLITVNSHLLAVGGEKAHSRTNNILEYINASWTVVGHMTLPRSVPFTAVIPGNKLMVVGGWGAPRKCELATIT